jgi:very-short-patch-repair endonuclease
MLVSRQHGVVSAVQLRALGFSRRAIQHRVARGRLHPVMRGVYAVGRLDLSRHGRWMAAVLACGPRGVLSHRSAAALWGIVPDSQGPIEVSLRSSGVRRRPGIQVFRRPQLRDTELTDCECIPVTTPVRTLVDLARILNRSSLERAINEADKLDLVDPETLADALEAYRGVQGVAPLRGILDRRTFRLTDSELERRFLVLATEAGLPLPLTGRLVNGFRVDFYWPDLGLVVETDGLRYHRTASQQGRDRLRDQTHSAAGFMPLRFTHAQVRFEAKRVRDTLIAVARRAESRRDGSVDTDRFPGGS